MTSALPARASRLRGARGLFTGRGGGAGRGDFASLNLALHVGDEARTVRRNRDLVAAEIGAPLRFVQQVHGTAVHVVEDAAPGPVVTADALVTARSDVALAIMVADCLPVLLSDPAAGVVGAAHAGRRGLLDGVLERTVEQMERLGADPRRLTAAIGPSVCGACYEVPAALREEAAARVPATWSTTSWGTPALDLRAGALERLRGVGMAAEAVEVDHPCTLEDEDFFSYRRSARTGRSAGVIRRD